MGDDSREAVERHEKNEDAEAAIEAIGEIGFLYPPDSEYPETAEIGKQDMIDALAAEWRTLPTPVLQYMARLQRARDHASAGK